MKKRMHSVLSVLLFCCLFVSVLSLNVSAAEVDGFYSGTMEHSAFTFQNVNNVLERVDYTNKLSVSHSSYLNEACTVFTLPADNSNPMRCVSTYHIQDLNASHEYNLKFKASSNLLTSTSTAVCYVYLVFYNGDEVLREQQLGGCTFDDSGWQSVDFDFVPDVSGLGGYKTRIEFIFMSVSSSATIYRLSDFIEFEDKDDNAGWFQKIINAIKEIPEKIGDLRDNISNYFSNLGDRITAKFENVGTSITNKFEEVKTAIGSWFTEIGDKLSNKFAEVGDAISSKFAEIGAEFSATFDKFKPRVYEQLNWVIGFINPSDGEYGSSNNNACVTDYFLVSDSRYYIERNDPDSEFQFLTVAKYDLNKKYINTSQVNNGVVFELEPGYYYRFRLYKGSDLRPYGDALSDYCNEYVLLYADEGWLTAFGRMILNGLKNFFIPSPDYFDTYSETTKTWAAEHFGFLYTAADLFSSVVEDLKGLLRDDYSFKIPAARFTLLGTEYTLWEEYEVPVKEYLKNSALSFAYNTYLVMLSGTLAFALLEYARKTYDKIMAN